MIEVTVSITKPTPKRPTVQAMLYWKDENGKKHQASKTTGIKVVKGKKKELMKLAEKKAELIRAEFEKKLNENENMNNIIDDVDTRQEMLFDEYLQQWLESIENTKKESTIGGYSSNINAIICPYFKELKIKLKDLKTIHLQDFFDYEYRLGKSARTVKHYYNNIHQALEKARKIEIIPYNPSDNCQLEKPKEYIPVIYNEEELNVFLKKIKGSDIEVPITLIAVYGLRREEVIGLKWSQIDWENNLLTISHVVTQTTIKHKRIMSKSNTAKNLSSYRSLPLDPVKNFLLKVKEQQEINKKRFGNAYKNTENYICVNEEGELMKPDRLTKRFSKFLKDNNLKKIRVHDLRHSIGSLLIKEASTREVQEWLGHANVSTTEIYTHLDSKNKEHTANVIKSKLYIEKMLVLEN